MPLTDLSMESVRFDLQRLENPEIEGVEYQQGTLFGYEVREYLLEKWGRKCFYCEATEVPLQIDHIMPRSKGGTDRVSNLTLACAACNQKKGNTDAKTFLAEQPSRYKALMAGCHRGFSDTAAVNSTRRALRERLCGLGVPLEGEAGERSTTAADKSIGKHTGWMRCVWACRENMCLWRQSKKCWRSRRWDGEVGRCAEWISMGLPEQARKQDKRRCMAFKQETW